jgi:hypothetical protein
MTLNPLNLDSAYNYARVVEKLFNHTLVYNDDYVQNNLVEVHIYLETNDIQYIVESQEYGFIQLFADLGAVFGMYLGIAFATVWEMVDMGGMLIYIACTKMFGIINTTAVKY